MDFFRTDSGVRTYYVAFTVSIADSHRKFFQYTPHKKGLLFKVKNTNKGTGRGSLARVTPNHCEKKRPTPLTTVRGSLHDRSQSVVVVIWHFAEDQSSCALSVDGVSMMRLRVVTG